MAEARTPPTKPFTIAIVGGGIGGVSLGIGLATQHVPFHIYESAASFGELGAGVAFGPNVVRAMHGISPRMLRAYAKHVTANEPPDLADVFLTYRRGTRPEGQEAGSPWTLDTIFHLTGRVQEMDGMQFPVRCSVHRAHFLDELVRLLPGGAASFGKTLVEIDEEGGAAGSDVVLRFADGSTATASAVVGCDGIKSVTRKHLHGPGATATYSGFFGYRAMVPRADFERVLGKELASTGNHYLCRNGYTIAYPVDHGAALNMVATCVQAGSAWADGEWRVPADTAQLLRDLRGWHPGVLELLVRHGDGQKWAMFHSPHHQPYCRDRICLLGDSAHATTPHMGAGAGMAIEGAFVLARLLGAIDSTADVPLAFCAYDAVRRPRSQQVIHESKNNVARYLAVACAQGDELRRLMQESHEKFRLIWEFDLDESLAEARRIVQRERATQSGPGNIVVPCGFPR